MTALDYAKHKFRPDMVKILRHAPSYILRRDRVMMSLHCASVVKGAMPRESGMTPLCEFCTDVRYHHMMESMMGMVLKHSVPEERRLVDISRISSDRGAETDAWITASIGLVSSRGGTVL